MSSEPVPFRARALPAPMAKEPVTPSDVPPTSTVPPAPVAATASDGAEYAPVAAVVWNVPPVRLMPALPVALTRSARRVAPEPTSQLVTPGTLAVLPAVPLGATVPAFRENVLLISDLSEPFDGAGPESPERMRVPGPSLV